MAAFIDHTRKGSLLRHHPAGLHLKFKAPCPGTTESEQETEGKCQHQKEQGPPLTTGEGPAFPDPSPSIRGGWRSGHPRRRRVPGSLADQGLVIGRPSGRILQQVIGLAEQPELQRCFSGRKGGGVRMEGLALPAKGLAQRQGIRIRRHSQSLVVTHRTIQTLDGGNLECRTSWTAS